MGEWRYSSIILGLGTRWRSVISFTPLPLYPQAFHPRYQLDMKLDRPHSRPGHYAEDSLTPAGNQIPIPGLSSPQPRHYIDWAIPAPTSSLLHPNILLSIQFRTSKLNAYVMDVIASIPFLIISGQYNDQIHNGHRDTIKFFINHISKYGNHQIPIIKTTRIITVVKSTDEQNLCIYKLH
jgi:hypothetical protein